MKHNGLQFFKDKNRQINEYCAKVRRKEIKLVVNRGITKIKK